MKKTFLVLLFFFFCFSALTLLGAQETVVSNNKAIAVSGRLVLENINAKSVLTLHSREGKLYRIKGSFSKQLEGILKNSGDKNLVSLEGLLSGDIELVCNKEHGFRYNKKGEKEEEIKEKCFRYEGLEITRIVSSNISSEEIVSPTPYSSEKTVSTNPGPIQNTSTKIFGEFYGTISSIDLRSPIEIIEITNQDKENPLRKLSLMVSPDTKVAKKTSAGEPIYLIPSALRVGQKVTVMYSRGERMNEAMVITITGIPAGEEN